MLSGNSTQTGRDQHVSLVALWRLVHDLDHLRPAQAAALLRQIPSEVAARALAHARDGMQITRELGARHLESLIAVLPPDSRSHTRLQIWRIVGRQPDRPKSAIDELEERINRNPEEVRTWYRH